MKIGLYYSTLALLCIAGSSLSCQEQTDRDSSISQYSLDQSIDLSNSYRVWVRLPVSSLNEQFIRETGFIRDHIIDDVFAFGYIDRGELAKINSDDSLEIVELDPSWDRLSFDPKSLKIEEYKSDDSDFEDYHDYEALTSELHRLEEQYSDLVKVESAGQSVEGRELWYLKISDNVQIDENEPKTLMIANMHGNETAGRELMVYLARDLLENYTSNERKSRIINHSQVYIMPSMNPDGFERGQRWNSNNVDLNRDFPDFTSDPNDTPNGRAVETQAIMRLHERHQFNLSLNFHGGAVCFNLPWDTKTNSRTQGRFGDDPLIYGIGREYADINLTMYNSDFDHGLTYGYEWYQVNGGMQDWASHYRKTVHATVELSQAKYPPARQLQSIWLENKESLYRFLDHGLDGAHLELKDFNGDPILNAEITISNLNRTLKYQGHQIHRTTLEDENAEFTVSISAEGHRPASIQLTTRKFNGVFDEIVLESDFSN